MSVNCHLENFGETWRLRGAAGVPVHTACVAFDLDRLGLALFLIHGADLELATFGAPLEPVMAI